jgi:hypothetical protein
MAHEARTDFSMLLGSILLLIVGAGSWSIDAFVGRRKAEKESSQRRLPMPKPSSRNRAPSSMT